RSDIFAARSQAFRHLVVTQVFLEQIHVNGSRGCNRVRPHAPRVVVVDHGDHGDLIFRRGVQFEHAVGDAGVTRDAYDRSALIRSLRADSTLYGRARADGHGKVRTDRAVLIRAVDHLSGTIATQPASGEVSDGPTAPAD